MSHPNPTFDPQNSYPYDEDFTGELEAELKELDMPIINNEKLTEYPNE